MAVDFLRAPAYGNRCPLVRGSKRKAAVDWTQSEGRPLGPHAPSDRHATPMRGSPTCRSRSCARCADRFVRSGLTDSGQGTESRPGGPTWPARERRWRVSFERLGHV